MTTPVYPSLLQLGWDDGWKVAFAPFDSPGLVPGRVAFPQRADYQICTGEAPFWAKLPGRVRRQVLNSRDLPIVGDWVVVSDPGSSGATVQAVLPRRSLLSRRAAGETLKEQPMVANVDLVLLIFDIQESWNPNRVERYLAVVREAGSEPLVILTKADAVADAPQRCAAAMATIPGTEVLAVSNVTGEGMAAIAARAQPGRTLALLGLSGVGKSSLVNRLAGTPLLRVGETRAGGAGRHTTTDRQLLLLESGALVIDTPGMRELALWGVEEGLKDTFQDLEDLAVGCRFANCVHVSEPGCALLAATAAGEADARGVENYVKLRSEQRALETRLRRKG